MMLLTKKSLVKLKYTGLAWGYKTIWLVRSEFSYFQFRQTFMINDQAKSDAYISFSLFFSALSILTMKK